MPNTIVLKGTLGEKREEYPANAALSPGHFLELMSTGKVRKNASAGVDVPLMVAVEDAMQGKTINDAYAANDPVHTHMCAKNDKIYARVAAGQAAIVIGDKLKLAADGTVTLQGGTGTVKFRAEEDVDNSAGLAEAFIKVRCV